MAASTGIVLAAGAFAVGDMVLTDWNPGVGLRVSVGTVAAAFVSAGLDKAVPGLGTGLAVLLLVGAILRHGPSLAGKLFPGVEPPVRQGFGARQSS